MNTTELSHAEQNAQGHAEAIAAAYEAHQFCAEEGEGRHLSREAKACLKEHGYDGTNHDDVAEAIEEAAREQPLSVCVRCSEWQNLCESSDLAPDEFQILLSTGGPALRIVGDLNNYLEPCRARLQHQDWGTPWTEWLLGDDEALLWFARLFWYGEA
jgi:hypothetical protein